MQAAKREARSAERAAAQLAFTQHISKTLRFSIEFPEWWRVTTDDTHSEPIAQQLMERLRHSGTEEELLVAERHAHLERMQIGLFQASPADNDNEEEVHLEVTKLRIPNDLTALELYQLDKQPSQDVPWGSRPKNGMTVDGLHGVLYYYLFNTGDAWNEQPVFMDIYLADAGDGWIISCSCARGDAAYGTLTKYKPVFKRIAQSFRRIRVL